MPNGRVHDIITITTAVVAAPVLLNSTLPEMGAATAIVAVGSYLASGLVFSPDLDLHSTPYKRWGPLRFIWKPYQKMVPHRSWVSHSFVFGPLIRVLYFAIAMTLLYLAGMALVNLFVAVDATGTLLNFSRTVQTWVETHPVTISYAVGGLIMGGAAHTAADLIYSWTKRKLRKIF
ncbi:MAG: metal-binding protein [Chloroflexota bacterium]